MRLVADQAAADWLATGPGFKWDAGNQTKNATKHNVTIEEAESLLQNAFVLAGRVIEPHYDERRRVLLGRATGGRLLTMVFTRRGDRLRIISCRPMAQKERKLCAKAVGN